MTPREIRAVADVAAYILNGRVLHSARATVGTYREATQPHGEVRFAAVAWDGRFPGLLVGSHVVRRTIGWHGVYPDGDETTEDDWSAFGAAREFVRYVGAARAENALKAAGVVPETARLAAIRQRGSACRHGTTGLRRRFCGGCAAERG